MKGSEKKHSRDLSGVSVSLRAFPGGSKGFREYLDSLKMFQRISGDTCGISGVSWRTKKSHRESEDSRVSLGRLILLKP